MDWLLSLVFLTSGFGLLLIGGDTLVKAAVSIAVKTKIPPATIGLTIIAAGTSAPELFTSILAVFRGSESIALGNVVGSNIFNCLAIVGVASLIQPNRIMPQALKWELPFLIFATVLFWGLSTNAWLSRIDGGLMLAVLFGFMFFSLKRARKKGIDEGDREEIEALSHGWKDAAYLLFGLAGLLGGADLALRGGVLMGQLLELSERVIGVTIISIGTGLPELATSAVAAYRGRDDIAIANVLGSNMMNTLAVLGTVALIHPLEVSEKIMTTDFYWMLGATIILIPLFLNKERIIKRPPATVLIVGYISYILFLLS